MRRYRDSHRPPFVTSSFLTDTTTTSTKAYFATVLASNENSSASEHPLRSTCLCPQRIATHHAAAVDTESLTTFKPWLSKMRLIWTGETPASASNNTLPLMRSTGHVMARQRPASPTTTGVLTHDIVHADDVYKVHVRDGDETFAHGDVTPRRGRNHHNGIAPNPPMMTAPSRLEGLKFKPSPVRNLFDPRI